MSDFSSKFLRVLSIASAAPYAYITNMDNKSVSVIDTATNNVIGMVDVGFDPLGVGVNSARNGDICGQ